MALNMKKTIKPRGASSKTVTVGGLDSFAPPSGVSAPAGTRGGSVAGIIDKPMPTNTGGGGAKGRHRGSVKGRIKPRGRRGINY